MEKVYVIKQEEGQWEDYTCRNHSVFASLEDAQSFLREKGLVERDRFVNPYRDPDEDGKTMGGVWKYEKVLDPFFNPFYTIEEWKVR